MSFIEVNSTDIELLDSTQLPDILRRLLNLEASKHDVPRSGINVAGSITTPDGGVDGSIVWQAPPNSTSQLSSSNLVFQAKAQDITSTAAGSEVENRPGHGKPPFIKPMVDKALLAGAGYILFTTQDYTDQQRSSAVESIRDKFREHSKPYADTALVDVYDRQKICDWVNDFLPAVIAVKAWRGIAVPGNFWSFEQWQDYLSMNEIEYFEDDELSALRSQVQQKMVSVGTHTRLVGPSGIGKTRLLFEACKAENDTDRIIYCDAAINEASIMGFVHVLNSTAQNCVLIIDNCPLDIHSLIGRMINSSITLISLDHNNDLSSGSGELLIPRVSDEVITQIVKSGWPEIDQDDLAFVIAYAEGFPLIATNLAKDTADGAANLGRLNDDTIKQKLLGPSATEADIRALEVMALFDHVGFENSASDQYKYIAEHIAGLEPNDFYKSIQKFERRQVIDTRGDYKRVKPLPLAIRLAADWWETNSPEHTRSIIERLSPNHAPPLLSESFCKVVTKLDFVERAVEVTADFCGHNGPFVEAELLKTAWGSRLFRAFVEVNPKATSNALYSVINQESFEVIESEYGGDCRRNLYWALEKLCFRSEVFEKSCWSLLRLAVAENESWGNNCTNLFKQLFSGFLSGTQAEPLLRLNIINRAIGENDARVDELVIGALSTAVENRSGGRIVGAENQGLNQRLEEWRATTWRELYDYQDSALELLFMYANRGSDTGALAITEISNSLRGMIKRENHSVLYEGIDNLVQNSQGRIPTLLNSIRTVKIYELKSMPDDMKSNISQMLDRWEEALSPINLNDKILQIVNTPSWDHLRDHDGEIVDLSDQRAIDFAGEFSNDIEELVPFAGLLVKGELRKGYIFARELASVNSHHQPFLTALLEGLRSIGDDDRGNPAVLASYLNAIRDTYTVIYDEYIDAIFNDDALCLYYIDCIRLGGVDDRGLTGVLNLILDGRIEPYIAKNLAYGSVTSNLEAEKIIFFANSLMSLNSNNAWIVLDIVYMYVHGNKEKWEACEEFFIDLISAINFNEQADLGTMDMHHWESVCKKLIDKSDSKVSAMIAGKVFFAATNDNSLTTVDHSLHVILDQLIKNEQYEVILEQICSSLRSDSPMSSFQIETLLGGSIRNQHHGHILDIPEGLLIKWSQDNPDIGPAFIAKASPLYEVVDDEYVCHSLTIKIADHYGDDIEILHNLSSFAGIKSWSGSRIPDMKGEQAAYKFLAGHQNHVVREWAQEMLEHLAKSIDAETRREEARDFGIY